MIALTALVGIWRGWRSRHYALIVGTALTIVLFTLATGSVGLEGKRLPMMLPLFVLAGLGVGGTATAATNAPQPSAGKQ